MDSIDTSLTARLFRKQGFAKGATKIEPAALEELKTEVQRLQHSLNSGQSDSTIVSFIDGPTEPGLKINNLWCISEVFRQVTIRAEILKEVAEITGAKTLRIWRDQLLVKPTGVAGTVKWHQDAFWWRVLSPANQITAWFSLDDVSSKNGCMAMIEGSHLWGLQTERIHWLNRGDVLNCDDAQLRDRFRDCELSAGEIHYHHCLTWHGSHVNVSPKMRAAYAIHFLVDDTAVSQFDHPIKDLITRNSRGYISGPLFPQVWPLQTESA